MSVCLFLRRIVFPGLLLLLFFSTPPQIQAQNRVADSAGFVTAIADTGNDRAPVFDADVIQFDHLHNSQVNPAVGDLRLHISSGHNAITLTGAFTDGAVNTAGEPGRNHTGRFLSKEGTGSNSTEVWELVFDVDTTIDGFGVKGMDDNDSTDHTGQGGAISHYIDQGGTEYTLVIGGTGNLTFSNNSALGGSPTQRASNNGLGGAISANLLKLEGSGTYRFENNTAKAGDSAATVRQLLGVGGAIHALNVNISGDGNYEFVGNSAENGRAAGESTFAGMGGAIHYSYGNSTFAGGGNILFEGNIARGGQATGSSGDIGSSGLGGAISSDRNSGMLDFNKSGQVIFRRNQAIGGSASDGAKASASGQGGAILAWGGNAVFRGDADYTFANNQASGGLASDGGDTSTSGFGGAVFGTVRLEGTGKYDFSGNKATGGNADGAGSNSSLSGIGGAIYGDFQTDGRGRYVFDSNQAVGGSASNGGNSSASGLGGALGLLGSGSDIVGGTFTNNKASTESAGDLSSGRGGAIFVGPRFMNTATFNLTSTLNNEMMFKGNTHNPGGQGETANSIYFGNVTPGNKRVNSEFAVEDGAQLLMYNPMASQEDGLTDTLGTPYGNVTVNISKTGGGSWVLAGHSDMRSAADWDITEGTLHLIPTEPVTRAAGAMAPAHINLSHSNSSFTLRDGAALMLTPARPGSGLDVYHQITANDISLESGSRVSLAGFSYGAMLGSGRHEILKLNAPGALDNLNSIDPGDVSGTIMIGAYSYDYNNLHWESADLLVLDASGGVLVPEPGGVPNITAPIVVATNNPANRVVYNQINGRLADLLADRCRGRMDRERMPYGAEGSVGDDDYYSCLKDTSVWVTPHYTYADYSGGNNRISYDLIMPSITAGIDHYLSDKVLVGASASFSPARFSGAGASIDADAFTVGLYGGALLPKKIELGVQAAFSRVDYDYRRDVFNTRYTGSYKSSASLFGVELGRTFDIGEILEIRPWISYEYLHVKTKGLSELSPGEYALNINGHSEDLNRLWAGASLRKRIKENSFVEGELYYLGQYGDTDVNAQAVFVNDPGQNYFRTYGEALDKHMGGVGLRAGLNLNDNTDVILGYDFKAGENTRAHHGALTLRYSW